MFNNIGGKIKGLAKFLCWTGIILSVISGIIMIANGASVSRGRYSNAPDYVGLGFLTMIAGSLFSWLGSFFMYGFGQLVEDTGAIRSKMDTVAYGANHAPAAIPADSWQNGWAKAAPEQPAEMPRAFIQAEPKFVNCPACGKRMSMDFIKARKHCPDCGRPFIPEEWMQNSRNEQAFSTEEWMQNSQNEQ